MKAKLLLLSFLLFATLGWGQNSVQNFGTSAGSFTSQTGSTTFIPNPTTSGTSWVRAGATAPNAPIDLVTGSNNPLGTTGACVKAAASSSGSVSKFSPAVGYTGGSAEFYTSFKVMFGDASGGTTATTGTWLFFQGVGTMYSDANSFTNTQLFTGLRFNFSDPGIVNLDYSATGSFVTTGLTTTTLNQGTVYTIEIFGNNKTSGTVNYNYGGTAQTVAVNKFDLYINGVLIGNDLTKGQIANNSVITATTFIGFNSVNNESNIFVDDVKVYNNIRPYTVTYNGNTNTGGAVPVDANSPYSPVSTVTALGNTGALVKTGNTFNGWNTAANGTGTAYVAGSTFTPAANTILYAQWLPTCAPPTQASTVTYSNPTLNGFDVNWTAGGGNGTMLVVRENALANALPVQGTPYTPNLNWASAGQIDVNNRVVFRATGNAATPITGLNPGTEYRVTAYEYNTAMNCYNLAATASALAYTRSTEPTAHAAAFSCSTQSPSQINLAFSAPNTVGGTGYIILQKIGSAPTGLPTDGVSYSVGATIGDATVAGYTSAFGTATSFPATGLASNMNYYFTLIPFNSFGTVGQTMNYLTSGTVPVTNCTTTIAPCTSEKFSSTGSSTYPSGWSATGMTSGVTPFVTGPAALQFTANSSTLVTGAIANPSQLKFYLQRNSSTNQKTFTIEVSTTSQVAGFTPVATYNNTTIPANSYSQYTVDLSAYTNNTIWIRFVKTSAATSVLYMDDMEVYCGTPTYPEMNVTGNAVSIADEDNSPSVTDDTDFGSALVGDIVTKTFTIQNTGVDPLNLTGTNPYIAISGTNAADFSVSIVPTTPVVAINGTTTFEITFQPSAAGLRVASLSIADNDGDENAYNFSIQGMGTTCTPTTTIASITPTSGPAGTLVTINGTGFTTASNVKFGALNAVYTVVSSTVITATVPTSATTGDIVIEDAGCSQKYSVFNVIAGDNSACAPSAVVPTELFISQVTDASSGGLSYVELYNATPSTIDLTNYKILIRKNGIATGDDIALTGTLASGQTFTLATSVGTSCAVSGGNGTLADQNDSSTGINNNDCIHLAKLGTVVDTWGVSNGSAWISSLGLGTSGYSFMRKETGTSLPTTTFNSADWIITDFNGCNDNYTTIDSYAGIRNPPISSSPVTTLNCGDNSAQITVTGTEAILGGAGLNYQWYYTAPGNAGWTMLSNAGIYSGVTSNVLNISNLTGLNGYQFYCQVMEDTATCYVASSATMISLGGFSTTWNGTTWNNGAPNSSTVVVISGNYNTTTNGDIDACSLTVNAGSTVTVSANHYITIQNNLTVNGTVDIQNGGSLIQVSDTGTNTGNVNMQRTANIRSFDYVYWSSPVANFGVTSISPGTSSNLIYKWLPTVGSNYGSWASANETMVKGKGYIVRGPSSFNNTAPQNYTATFTGVPYNGAFTTPIERGNYTGADYVNLANGITVTKYDDNWNLIGNPYASAISALDFLTENTNLDGFVNLWTHGSLPNSGTANPFYSNFTYNYSPSDYITYNGTGTTSGPSGFNGYIAAGQGFFVNMNDGPATISTVNFKNSMRSKTYDNSQFYRTDNVGQNANGNTQEKNRIWLDLISSTNTINRTLVGYVTGATLQRDRMFDAVTKVENTQNFYSVMNNESYVIQGRPVPFDVNDKVQLGAKLLTSGNYTIALSATDGVFVQGNIYLEDKLLNIIHDLKQSPYVFTSNAGRIDNRFELRYSNQTLSNPDFDAVQNGVVIYANEAIHVTSASEHIKDVIVYDILGRVIAEKKTVNGNSVNLTNVKATQSALIVKVILENGLIVDKKIIF